MSESTWVRVPSAVHQRQAAAEAILLQWLVAWRMEDVEQRLIACSRRKLDVINWQKRYRC